jgi:hypothetical protein
MNVYGYDVPHLPISLLSAVAVSDVRMWMFGSDLIHGGLRLLHLLGAAGFLGTVLVINLKQLGFFAASSLQPMRAPLLIVLEVAFWLTIASGVLLFVYDPIGIGLHTMFLPKLILTVIGFAVAKWPRRAPLPLVRRGFATTSLTIWLLVMVCSTWNHIEHPRNPADIYRHEQGRERTSFR